MNRKRSKLVQVMAVSLVVIGLLIAAWPGVAQSTQLRRQPDQMRDSIGIPERASAELRQLTAQPASSTRPTGSNPGAWTLASFATYQDQNTPFEISTANGDGSNLARRTFNSAVDTTPNVNRGGTRIVFISYRTGNGEVYVMNADGSGQTRLTNTSANEYMPSWSPDGTKIVFYSYRNQVNNNGNAEIYVMNADGTNQTRLTFNTAWDGHPAWSPDGTQIVFSSKRNGTYDLFKMSLQGTNQTQLTYGAPTAFYPDWSPDGSTIIFNYDPNGDDFLDIATVSANGGSYTPLSYAPYQTDEAGPKWDPTGHYYAFASVDWVYIQGNWYWNTAYVRARQIGGSDNWNITSSGNDWYPDWKSTDITAPASQVAALSQWTTTTAFNVGWSGSDNSSGVASYDIQYRDGINGAWTDWKTNTGELTDDVISFMGPYSSIRGSTYDLYIGARYASPLVGVFQGAIDNLRLYNRPLTVNEIQALYQQPAIVSEATSGCDSLVTTGLLACYPFDGNANDSSGYGHNGTVFGAVLTSDRYNQADSAYHFDGSSTYIQVPASPELNNLNSAMSIVAWIKTDPGTSYVGYEYRHILGKGATFGNLWADYAFGLSNPTGALVWEYANASNSVYREAHGDPVSQGQWHMLVANFDHGQINLYLDGVLAFAGQESHTYYFRSRARDNANNLEAYPGGNGDALTTVDSLPPTVAAYSPAYVSTTLVPVTWSGTDAVSGIITYDLQYRDGLGGTWTDWRSNVTYTSTQFTGQIAHTYFFRARARDRAGNLSAYKAAGDSTTSIYQYDLAGWILNNRAQPVAVATVQSDPAALNTAITGNLGQFHMYYGASEIITLTITRSYFGSLPPDLNLRISDTLPVPILYLPPLDNQIGDSHFESGDLSAWIPNGASGDLTPTITSTAHTGNYAALLGGSVPTDTITTGPWHSTIEQTINISPMIVSGTLSLLYRVDAVEPLSDTLNAYLIGANNVLTFTLPVTTSVWIHAWFDVSAWAEPTATVKIDFAVDGVGREARIILDEITWGSAITGSHAVFLPVVRR